MNTLSLIKFKISWCLLVSFHSSFASSPGNPIRVEIENEGKSIAQGFDRAFDKLPLGAKYALIKSDQGPRYLAGSVKDISAFEAVIMIEMDQGPVYVIPASDLLQVSNVKPD